ncbi:hypothetical protein D3C71_1893880 [compost metagenome]
MRPGIPAHIEGVLSKSDAGVYGHVVAGAISLQPGMFLIGDTMASFGPWHLIGSHLPAPRHSETAMASVAPSVSDEQTASVVPLPEEKPVQVAEADFVAPIPLPRP